MFPLGARGMWGGHHWGMLCTSLGHAVHSVCQPSGFHDKAERFLTWHPSCAAGVEQLASICKQERSCTSSTISNTPMGTSFIPSCGISMPCSLPGIQLHVLVIFQAAAPKNTILLFMLLIFLFPCQSDSVHPEPALGFPLGA